MARLTGLRIVICVAIAFAWAFGAHGAQAKTLRLVNDDYLSPPGDVADDKAPGFGVELVRRIFAGLGQDVSFEFFPTKRATMMVRRGERDGMLATLHSIEAERFCSFPDEPLVYDRWVMFVRAADIGKLKFSSFDDLLGHDVAVHAPPSPTPAVSERLTATPELWEFLREHHSLVETTGSDESLRMLAAGRADYAVVNLAFGTSIIARTGLSGKVGPLLSHSVIERGVYVCFNKTRISPAFIETFSHALKQFKQIEAYRVLYRKYYR